MSENKHAPEPWYSDSKGGIWRRPPSDLYENGGGIAGDKPLAFVNIGGAGENAIGYPVEANARRIVACVNACAGIPTAVLEERRTEAGEWYAEFEKIKTQRDELLAALCMALPFVEDHQGDPYYKIGVVNNAVMKIRSAIASVEGGAAQDDQCAECNSISHTTPAMCRQCEENTPAFTEAVNQFMKGGAS